MSGHEKIVSPLSTRPQSQGNIPLSRGGLHDWSNVCLSCPVCNLTKHTKTAEEFLELLSTD